MTANTWSSAGAVPAYPYSNGCTRGYGGVIANGSVVIGGGFAGGAGGALQFTSRYDPGANAWTNVASYPFVTVDGGSAPISNGSILSFAGFATPSFTIQANTYRYDPGANTWTQAANYPISVYQIGSAALSNGSILGVGGSNTTTTGPAQANCYRYDPGANTWTQVANYPLIVSGASCSLIGNGCILSITGANNGGGPVAAGVYANCYLYDPSANSWARTADYPIKVYLVASAPLTNGSVLAWGGSSNYTSQATANCYRYDPGANSWTQVANYPTTNDNDSSAVLLSNGLVMGIGGQNCDSSNVPQPNCYVYDPGYVTVSSGSAGMMVGL